MKHTAYKIVFLTLIMMTYMFVNNGQESSAKEVLLEINDLPSISEEGVNHEEEEKKMLNIQVGETILKATLENNSSVEALIELLESGPITIQMKDYAGVEKVGSFPDKLPTNDQQISVGFGDLILYQGKQFVIYYDNNSWSFTRLGHIKDISQTDLKALLGKENVEVMLYMD
jgi:hypothetical protein